MKRIGKQSLWWLLFALLLAPAAALAQDQKPEHGSVEFGYRHIWGDVYGRPDLPFKPDWETSRFNEYRDLKSGVFIRDFRAHFDDIFDTRFYVTLQSQKSFYDDQAYLASFGQYGKFKLQFRYEETPHIFSNTTRTLFTRVQPGVFTVNPALRATLQATSSANIPFVSQSQVATMDFITPRLKRKLSGLRFSYDPTPQWNLFFQFSSEKQVGLRPIAFLFNSSPSASATGGYGAEVPEPIDYFTNVLKVGAEYSREGSGFQASYLRSSFDNNITSLTIDNPYRTTDCVSPTGCTSATQGPATGVMDLYPDNHADYLTFAGAIDLGDYVRLMASVSPGWLDQNDAFLPYTSNTLRLAQTGPLPAPSLNGDKQTLAMNYTLVASPVKNVQLKAAYRHYDYDNNTPILLFTPVQGDFGAPNLAGVDNEHRATSYFRKTLELTGNWYFAKRNSVKVGYEGEWFDRTRRDVEDSREDSFIAAADLSPHKDLLFRLSYRHSNRKPDHYEDELSEGIPCEAGALADARAAFEFPDIHPCARRFDEAARVRDRGDILVEYSPSDKLTFTGSFSTTQDDFNRRGGTNSATPLNFLTGSAATLAPYYLYGVLTDLTYNYTFDANYAPRPEVSFFAEYSHERYHRTMTSRYRAPESTTLSSNPNGCGSSSNGLAFQGPCDSANNDWFSRARDFVDVWTAGLDLFLGRKVYVTAYYSLAAAKSHIFNRALGTQPANFLTQPTRRDGTDTGVSPVDRFVMTTTSSATDYPQSFNRAHEATLIFKYKLRDNIMPKLEYTYQQVDDKDFQTGAMTPFMGCVATTGVPAMGGPGGSPSISATNAPGCPVFGPTPASSIPSEFYPGSLVGDTSAARYFFLGVDKPSYRTHRIAASIVYTF
ncbi:MAG TPA: MtrB/PioB family outer membrane beta-barrel protein [Candidatus Acidoferrales bacterium]|nr:MtrB/PioB family outer membrane beta-barrel protein [Candidatus Acidoferrales bacterium]